MEEFYFFLNFECVIHRAKVRQTNSELVSETAHEKYRLQAKDLLIGMDANFHLNFWGKEIAYLNQRSVRIRARANSVVSSMQAFFELSPHIKARENNVSRTTVGHLSDKDLKRLYIICSIKTFQFNPEKSLDALLEKIISNRSENQRLSDLRDWLLPMLMNGQVMVGESAATEQALVVEKDEKLVIADSKKGFAKQVLGGKIVSLFQNDPNFTNIKFQKLQYLAEHVAEVDLNWNYYYQAAGPYDNVYMHTVYDRFKTSQWFAKPDYKFVPLEKQPQIEGYYQEFFKPVLNRLDHLFSLLADATDVQAEIIATLYAVWNNRLILNQPITDEVLIEDFYSWSDRKLMYAQEQLVDSLHWMRTHGIVPTGFGKEIKKARSKK